MSPPIRVAAILPAVVAGILTVVTVAAESPSRGGSAWTARAVVETVNAVVESDITIPAADSVACRLERLPARLPDLLPHLPEQHRLLIEECTLGRIRTRRGLERFGLDDLVEEGTVDSAGRAAIAGAFADRSVDVTTGMGLSEGPYPLSFDWAVVLDRESHTLFSFVLNCRD
jgi:hypothetical protein